MAEPPPKKLKRSHGSLLSDLESTAAQRRSPPPVPTLRELCELPVATCWYGLGVQLGIPDNELDVIQQNYPRDTRMCQSKMFSVWLRNESAPTYEEMVKALVAVDKTSLAEMLCGKYGMLDVIGQSHSLHIEEVWSHSLGPRPTLHWVRSGDKNAGHTAIIRLVAT